MTFPALTTALTLSQREAPDKALVAAPTFPAFTASATLDKRPAILEEITADKTFPAFTATATISKRLTGPPIALLPATKAFAAATFGPAFLQQREASGIALAAGVHFPQFTATLHLSKGAAMPPGQVTGLTFVDSGYTDVTIRYDQPDVGTGIFLHYEYRVDSEPWVSTMSADTLYTITGLLSGTLYSIRVRGVSNVGRGPASMPIEARTQPVVPPTLPLRFRLQVPGGGLMEQTWETPANNGGSPITHYEVQVIDPDGDAFPPDSTGTPTLRHRTRGLQPYQRYGFRVRGVNEVGAGRYTSILYATPNIGVAAVEPVGLRMPLLDLDRQSLIVRLSGQDCRLSVWWQPMAQSSWFAVLRCPPTTRSLAASGWW